MGVSCVSLRVRLKSTLEEDIFWDMRMTRNYLITRPKVFSRAKLLYSNLQQHSSIEMSSRWIPLESNPEVRYQMLPLCCYEDY
jgi:hypothetical protein